MPLPHKHHPIEALRLDRENESLRIRVQIWAPRGQPHRRDTCVAEKLSELSRVERIAVMDQEALPFQEAADVIEPSLEVISFAVDMVGLAIILYGFAVGLFRIDVQSHAVMSHQKCVVDKKHRVE